MKLLVDLFRHCWRHIRITLWYSWFNLVGTGRKSATVLVPAVAQMKFTVDGVHLSLALLRGSQKYCFGWQHVQPTLVRRYHMSHWQKGHLIHNVPLVLPNHDQEDVHKLRLGIHAQHGQMMFCSIVIILFCDGASGGSKGGTGLQWSNKAPIDSLLVLPVCELA